MDKKLNMFNPLNYSPYSHIQLSTDYRQDGEYCLSCMLVDALTPLCKLYGDNTDYNPQYIAETSHTTQQGNTEFNVDQAWYQYGLVGNDVLPELTKFSWADIYGRDLTKVIPIGQRFWDKYDPKESYLQAINPSQAVALSKQATFAQPYTIAVIVDLNNGLGSPLYHGQALLNGMIWDSYLPNLKPVSHPIIWAYKLILTPKHMSNTKLVKNGTEWGFYLPATNEQAMIDKANNMGYALPTLNNGQNVDWANIKPDLIIS